MIRVSYSILSAWSKGYKEQAINGILRIPIEQNEAMKEGSRIHSLISETKPKLLPFMDDTFIFEDIRPEKSKWVNYFKIRLNDEIDFSMVVDCYSPKRGIIIDWKTGKHKSNKHDKMQLFCYAYALGFRGVNLTKGVIAKVDSKAQLEDFSAYTIGEREKKEAEQFIFKNVEEIKQVL